MNKNLLYLILIFPSFLFGSNINGYAFLDNNSNHNNINIKFIPVSGSAQFSEGLTDSNGLFNISVVSGVYNISYEKTGYQTYVLNQQFISSDITLADVTLSSNPLVYVSGDVSGTWVSTNTYIVNGNINIPVSQTLLIEENTEIKFQGYYSLQVNGTLNATGTESNYITFTSTNSNPSITDWDQIKFNTSSTNSIMEYCIVEYGKEDFSNDDGIIRITTSGGVQIKNCIIRHSDEGGISTNNQADNILIKNNIIHDCDVGIYVNGGSNSANSVINITNNDISNGRIGIASGLNLDATLIQNNYIHGFLVGVNTYSNLTFKNNIIYNNGGSGSGQFNTAFWIGQGQPKITNNTIINNANAISIWDSLNPNPILNSNIIAFNSARGIYSVGANQPSLVTYNLIYNNGLGIGNNLPAGVGTVVTQNINGTDSDTYFNIFVEPNLASIIPTDSDFCELLASSEAINAGDPNIPNPFDSSIIDIGAKEFGANLFVNEFSIDAKIVVFPNPIKNFVSIKSPSQTFNVVIIYDLNGRLIKKLSQDSKLKEMTILELDFLSQGFYIFKIFDDNTLITSVKILKK